MTKDEIPKEFKNINDVKLFAKVIFATSAAIGLLVIVGRVVLDQFGG